jgi:hypothetical protein
MKKQYVQCGVLERAFVRPQEKKEGFESLPSTVCLFS